MEIEEFEFLKLRYGDREENQYSEIVKFEGSVSHPHSITSRFAGICFFCFNRTVGGEGEFSD